MFLFIVYIGLGIAAFILARYLERKGKEYSERADRMQRDLDVFIANYKVSAFCCKSIVYRLGPSARCECFVCRRERGESVTEETQALAGEIQHDAMMTEQLSWRRKK